MSTAELRDEFRALVKAADRKKPTQKQLSNLRAFLNAHPEALHEIANLPQSVSIDILEKQVATGASREVIKSEMKLRGRALGYATSPALEQMLIEQILMCWLRMHLVEYKYTAALSSDSTYRHVEHYEKRVSAAQRRYLQAVQALARVRKLAQNTPALQFNIAEQQIVAGR